MQISEALITMLQALVIGFFIIPVFQTISLHGIQIALIRKHKLPMSGIRWSQLLPNMIRTYFGFLVRRHNQYIACKTKDGKGGFEWRGVFSWKVW